VSCVRSGSTTSAWGAAALLLHNLQGRGSCGLGGIAFLVLSICATRADREVISLLSRLTRSSAAAVARLMLANAGLGLLMCGLGVSYDLARADADTPLESMRAPVVAKRE